MPDSKHLHVKRLGRELAMQFLFQHNFAKEKEVEDNWEVFFKQAASEHGLRENRLARKANEYARMILDGLQANEEKVDACIKEKTAKWDLDRMAIVDRNILRIATYEMLFVADVPPIVSINEAVEIARDYSDDKSGNFVNGVLNAVKDSLSRPARKGVDKL